MFDEVPPTFLTPAGERLAAALIVIASLLWWHAQRAWRRAHPPTDHPACARCGRDVTTALAAGACPACHADLSRAGYTPAGVRRSLPARVSHAYWLLAVATGACAAASWASGAGLLPRRVEVVGALDLASVAAESRTAVVHFTTVAGTDPVPAVLYWGARVYRGQGVAAWDSGVVESPDAGGSVSASSLPAHLSERTPPTQPLAVSVGRVYELAGLDFDSPAVRAERAELTRLLEETRAAFDGPADVRHSKLVALWYRPSMGVVCPFRVTGSLTPTYSYPAWLTPVVVAGWGVVWGAGAVVIQRRSRTPRAYTEPTWELDSEPPRKSPPPLPASSKAAEGAG